MLEFGITLLISAIVVIAIVYIISIWIYKRAPANMGFIRTGFGGTKVCLGRGAIVLPVFHEVSWISLETIKLIVSRSREQAILTSDNIRVDVVAELYAHVGHTEDDLLTASRSLGEKTFDADKVRNLLEAKVVSTLRSYAATKTLNELHENRDTFAKDIKASVVESFQANGLALEEVTIVTLEQTSKEHFNRDNVFDAEGLRIITEITSKARREVHDTEKRTIVSLRQKDLDTQLELLEIERQEAFARAGQDKDISNEEALQVGRKQIFVLDQQKAVEEKEIENELELERRRTEREISITEEGQHREASEIRKALALEQERRDKEIAIIAKAKEEELAEIARGLAREGAEKERDVELAHKERERQQADIDRVTAVAGHEETAKDKRHQAEIESDLSMRRRNLENRLAVLDIEKEEALATARQEHDVSNEKARVLSEKQRYILQQRWEVEQEEIDKDQAFEKAQINKEASVIDEGKTREAAEIRRALARELEEREREIALIAKEQEREKADIRRFLARETEERDREIALADKTRQLEEAEVKRLKSSAEREQVEHEVESVRIVADARRDKDIDRIEAEKLAESRRIEEENKAQINRMHMVTQSEARKLSAEREADATLIRAKATSEAQEITAVGIEREAGAKGRAEMEIEGLRVENTQRMLEAEATGIEAKATALKNYDEVATFLELAKLHIEAERDIHIDQAKAMGNALQHAQIRMYGGEGGTVDTIRGMFTTGFGLGEVLEGVAHSLPDGLRERFAENGLRGIFGRPYRSSAFHDSVELLDGLVREAMGSAKERDVPFAQAVALMEEKAGDDEARVKAVELLKEINEHGVFDDVAFEKVWALLQATAKSSG